MLDRSPIQFLFFLLLIGPASSWASNWQKAKGDHLKTELAILFPSSTVEVKGDPSLGERGAKFLPNVGSKTGVGFSYRNLGATLSLSNPQKDDVISTYGESRSTDLQFRFYGKRTYEFTYQEYSGFYLQDPSLLDPSEAGKVALKRSDMSVRSYGFHLFWNFHEEDFSNDPAYGQSGRQVSSGWGAQALMIANHQVISADSAFVPSVAATSFGNIGTLKKIERTTLGLGGGLGGIAVYNSWYTAGLLALAFGNQSYRGEFSTLGADSGSLTGFFASVRLSLGYNGEKHVFGIQAINDGTGSQIQKGNISSSTIDSKVFYAYRWDGVDIPIFNFISSWFD